MTSKEDRQKLKEDEIYRIARKLNSAASVVPAKSPKKFDPDIYYNIFPSLNYRSPSEQLLQEVKSHDPGSCLLLNGQRGNGKTTELLRLQDLLNQDDNYHALYLNLLDFIDPYTVPNINQVLIAVAAAVTEALGGQDDFQEFINFLNNTKVEKINLAKILELDFENKEITFGKSDWASLKLNYKGADIVSKIASSLKNKEIASQNNVSKYLEGLFKKSAYKDKTIVLLIDSLEQCRDSSSLEKQPVTRAILEIFDTYIQRLSFATTISIWAAPPSADLGGNPVARGVYYLSLGVIPVLQRQKTNKHFEYLPVAEHINSMCELLSKRVPELQDICPKITLACVAWFSSGLIRRALKLLAEAITEQLYIDQQEGRQGDFKVQLKTLISVSQSTRSDIYVKEDLEIVNGVKTYEKPLVELDIDKVDLSYRLIKLTDNEWLITYFDNVQKAIWYAPSRQYDFDDALETWHSQQDSIEKKLNDS